MRRCADATDKLSRPAAARDDSFQDRSPRARRAAHLGAGIDIAGSVGMSTPYRSSGCARCGSPLPSEAPDGAKGSPAPAPAHDTPLCEGCVLEAITDARRLLERLDARPTRAPTSLFERSLAVVGFLSLGAAAAYAVTFPFGVQRQLNPSRVAAEQMQGASPGRAAEDPRSSSLATPPRDPMASSLTASAGAAWRPADPPRPFAHASASEPLPWPPAILATSGSSVTHDPQELFARAERLAAAGVDVTLRETRLSSATLPVGTSTGLGPTFHEGRPIGVKISLPGPLLESIGIESGDLVTSINGYGYPEDPKRWAEPFLQPSGNVVMEVLRGARRVVLSVRWRRPLGS